MFIIFLFLRQMGTSIFRNTFNKGFHGNQKNVC